MCWLRVLIVLLIPLIRKGEQFYKTYRNLVLQQFLEYRIYCDVSISSTAAETKKYTEKLILQRNSMKCCANLRKVRWKAWQYDAYGCLNGMFGSAQPKNATQLKSKVMSIFIIFFDFKGIVQKEFVLAGQTVNFM
jgi:hypothetical protein